MQSTEELHFFLLGARRKTVALQELEYRHEYAVKVAQRLERLDIVPLVARARNQVAQDHWVSESRTLHVGPEHLPRRRMDAVGQMVCIGSQRIRASVRLVRYVPVMEDGKDEDAEREHVVRRG